MTECVSFESDTLLEKALGNATSHTAGDVSMPESGHYDPRAEVLH